MAVNPWAKSSKFSSDINVTPLADVTLSLLILFLVITPLILYSFTADLPRTDRGGVAGQVEQEVVVKVTDDNVIQLNGKEMSEEEFAEGLLELFPAETSRERKVIFDGGRKARYEKVVRVMDILRKQGIEAVGVR